MSIYLFVIDGLGMWNSEKKSTFHLLDEKCSFNDNDLSFLYKIGLKYHSPAGILLLYKNISFYATCPPVTQGFRF